MFTNTCSKMSVCFADITGTQPAQENLLTTRDRDNLEMASLVLNKFLILYGTKTNLISKFL